MGGVIGRGEDEPVPAGEPGEDWTSVDADSVPPWRQEDRALVDAARAAALAAPPDGALEIARDLRRLAALHDDDVLSDAEYVAAARARLSGGA
jgi:hypothetical protein